MPARPAHSQPVPVDLAEAIAQRRDDVADDPLRPRLTGGRASAGSTEADRAAPARRCGPPRASARGIRGGQGVRPVRQYAFRRS